MKKEFTKGEWTVFNKEQILEGSETMGIEAYQEKGDSVSIVVFQETYGIDPKTELANAKLIAAAPELLEALELIVDRVERDWHLFAKPEQAGLKTAFISEAKEAIKKATE